MNKASPLIAAVFALLATSVASGCNSPDKLARHIALNGFSETNYNALSKYLHNKVCITGVLTIDSMGVYYALQPAEGKDGAIDLGFSRINTELNRVLASQKRLKNGDVHTLCGLLKDTTPFKGCTLNYCKWYTLTGAEPSRTGQGNRDSN